jgi:hypothetical protein
MAVPVELISTCSDVVETALTEDVSPAGVSVLTTRLMPPGESWILASLARRIRTPVRVVTCWPKNDGRFRVGLQVKGPPLDWSAGPAGNAA